MAKVHIVVDYIRNLEIGKKLSVRSIAGELKVSEGTAYKAIKECEEEGYLKTLPRAGTVRVESPKEKKIKNLSYRDILKIVDGTLLGGEKGMDKPVFKFIIGAMELDAIKKYITPGGILIVGNREAAQQLALKNNSGVLISGGFDTTEKIREMADKADIPLISSSYDTFTIATLINRAISQNLIRQRILYVSDILSRNPVVLKADDTINSWKTALERTNHDKFPVVDNRGKLVGIIGPKDAIGKDGDENIEKYMRKPVEVNPKTTVAYAAHVMEWEGIDLIPVTEGDRIVGVIARGDVLKGLKEKYTQHKTSRTIEDRILETFTMEEKNRKYYFTGKVTGEMLDPLGTMSRSFLSMLITKCSSIVFKNRNLYTEINSISLQYIKPIQPEHRFSVEVEAIETSKTHFNNEVRVYDSDGDIAALGIVSAVQ